MLGGRGAALLVCVRMCGCLLVCMVLPCTYGVVDANDYVNMNNSNKSNNCKGYPKPSKVITTQPADIWGRRWFLVVAYAPNRGLCMVMRCCGGDAALYGLLLCMYQSVLGVR